MKLSGKEFRQQRHKAITLLGMSGVGKTRLARILRKRQWFHYSVDYRIGTRYLDEVILDNIKNQAMQIPFLKDLLRSDSIHINNNIEVDNLQLLSTFLGKLGNPEKGGLGIVEFKRRQKLHHEAELAALRDVPKFIGKAREIYGYDHFVNDAGGSLCELDDDGLVEDLAKHTLFVYIKAGTTDEQKLIKRAEDAPKPLYYREDFLDEQLATYLDENSMEYAALIDPDDFCRWIFPRLFYARIPRYESITERYGYTITTDELTAVKNEEDFLNILERVLDEQN